MVSGGVGSSLSQKEMNPINQTLVPVSSQPGKPAYLALCSCTVVSANLRKATYSSVVYIFVVGYLLINRQQAAISPLTLTDDMVFPFGANRRARV